MKRTLAMRIQASNKGRTSLRGLSLALSKAAAPAGFTLVEAAVATGVIGVMLVSLYSGFSMGFGAVAIARENERATQILVQKLETVRLYTWTQLNTTNFIPGTFQETLDPDDTNHLGLVFTGSVSIASSPITCAYSNSIKLVTVGLNWTSAKTSHQRQVQTLVSQYGLQNYIY